MSGSLVALRPRLSTGLPLSHASSKRSGDAWDCFDSVKSDEPAQKLVTLAGAGISKGQRDVNKRISGGWVAKLTRFRWVQGGSIVENSNKRADRGGR
jgi:hypothetical protein